MYEKSLCVFLSRDRNRGTVVPTRLPRSRNRLLLNGWRNHLDKGGANLQLKKRNKQTRCGGHTWGEIWRSVGGKEEFAKWMEEKLGWWIHDLYRFASVIKTNTSIFNLVFIPHEEARL
jgi:hypothetical protein